jgi:flavin reductase (DIM6/NTAB) family NADH-FMN oxidoreductase RutF
LWPGRALRSASSSARSRRCRLPQLAGAAIAAAADWDIVPHRTGPTGSPRLHGVLATLECTVEHRLPGGDHEILVGRVRDAETGNGEAAPLLFWRGRYASLDGAAPTSARS